MLGVSMLGVSMLGVSMLGVSMLGVNSVVRPRRTPSLRARRKKEKNGQDKRVEGLAPHPAGRVEREKEG